MGYTHYWRKRGDISVDAWSEICKGVAEVLGANLATTRTIAGGMGDAGSAPICNHSEITFNGIGENSHETFYLTRHTNAEDKDGKGWSFDFCKTAHKPYDTVVCAALILLAQHTKISEVEISSDGDWGDFQRGMALLEHLGIKVSKRTVAKLQKALGGAEAEPVVAGISLRRQASW